MMKQIIRLLAAGGIGIGCVLVVVSMDDHGPFYWFALVGWGVSVLVFCALSPLSLKSKE